MAKRARKSTLNNEPCPECGLKFDTRGGMAIHLAKGHKWKKDKIHEFFGSVRGQKPCSGCNRADGTHTPGCRTQRTHVDRKFKKSGQPVVFSSNNFKETILAFEEASRGITNAFHALLSEKEFYKKERDEVVKKFETMRNLFK